MPKRTLIFQCGEYYHIYNRGAARRPIFRAEANYLFVLRRMWQYAKTYQLTIIAYCLLPNHYHWLVRQNGTASAGLLPQHVFNSYTKAYNQMYDSSGTLFESRYKAKHVTNEAYLLQLCRYVHANPVKDGLVSDAAAWPYSNYQEWLNIRDDTLIDKAFIDAHFPDRQIYALFVKDYLRWRQMPKQVAAHVQEIEV